MTMSRDDVHPSMEILAAFVDGLLSDPRTVEAHIDECEECALSVASALQLKLLASQGLIPALSSEQRMEKWRKLKQSVSRPSKADGSSKKDDSPQEPNSNSLVNNTTTLLGTLTGGVLLGQIYPVTKPMLAATELPTVHGENHSSVNPTSNETDNGSHGAEPNSGENRDLDVIPGEHGTSIDHAREILDRIEEMIGTEDQDEAGTEFVEFSESHDLQHGEGASDTDDQMDASHLWGDTETDIHADGLGWESGLDDSLQDDLGLGDDDIGDHSSHDVSDDDE